MSYLWAYIITTTIYKEGDKMKQLKIIESCLQACANWGLIPTSFRQCMTWEEQVLWLSKFINQTLIPAINDTTEATQELQALFIELKDYVDNYFANLDVQEEINNKLDQMAEDGTLEEIIAQYLQLASVLAFDSVDSLRAATNIVDGNLVETFGFYNAGDGGGAKYYVRGVLNDDVIDNVTILALNDPTLVAVLIVPDNEVKIRQFGCKADGTTDDTASLQLAIDYAKAHGYYVLVTGWCKVTTPINTKGVKIKGVGKLPMMTNQYISKTYGNIGWDYLNNVNQGALITFADFVTDYLDKGSGICSESASPIIYCHHNDGKFELENIGVAGWLRTANQDGIKSTYNGLATGSYIEGKHHFKDVNVFNCGGNGIHLQSLEMVSVNNLRSEFNFGKGLFIEGDTDYDTPFEYVNFENCWFTHNKGEGVHAYKCFRKDVTFSHCNSSSNGLYNQLSISVPNTTSDIIPSYKIEGYNGFLNSVQSILNFKNCYGEEQPVMISVIGYENNHPFDKITVENCCSYPFGQRSANALIYVDQWRLNYFSVQNNYTQFTNESGAKQIVFSGNVNTVLPYECDMNFYNIYMSMILPTLTYHANYNASTVQFRRYGNIIYAHIGGTTNAEIPAYNALVSNLPKPEETVVTIMKAGSTIIRGSLYTNRVLSSSSAIPNGVELIIDLVYPVKFDADKNGS